jgi:hypothetical protein
MDSQTFFTEYLLDANYGRERGLDGWNSHYGSGTKARKGERPINCQIRQL